MFIDETSCSSKDHTRTFSYMYAMSGESAVDHRWFHRGTRISAIAAMSSSGMLAVETLLMEIDSLTIVCLRKFNTRNVTIWWLES